MEKVENLYCTARVQNAMPLRLDHMDESGWSGRFKPARRSRDFRDIHDGDRDDTDCHSDRGIDP